MHYRFLVYLLWIAFWYIFGWYSVFAQPSISDISSFQGNSTTLTRYDLAEFLSLADCEQCLLPSAEQILTYDAQWWDTFRTQPGNNFDDVESGQEYYEGNEYSICIASAADKWWINGYPRDSSPFCPGRFCGANTLSYAELVQAAINIIAPTVYQKYSLNRRSVSDRAEWIGDDVDIFSRQKIQQALDRCLDSDCLLEDEQEFEIYLRYCRRHLTECDMLTTNTLTTWEYPIAMSNILVDQWLVVWPDVVDMWRYDEVTRLLFDQILWKIVSQKSCTWTIDYDLDGVQNPIDNCPVTYNPDQRDRDRDGDGDVCDLDLDGDWQVNPIGIIDDEWNIDHNKIITPWDDEVDIPDEHLPNPPGEGETSRAFSISADPLSGTTLTTISFSAQVQWETQVIERTFWDGYFGIWEQVSHQYNESWLYIVKVVATWMDGTKSVAKVSINIDGDEELQVAFQWYADPLVGIWPLEVSLSHDRAWEIDAVRRFITDTEIEVAPWEVATTILEQVGLYEIVAEAYNNNTLVWVSRISVEVVWAWDEKNARWARIFADPLSIPVWEIINFSSVTTGFAADQIASILRDFGDETGQVEAGLETSHRYTQAGPHLVSQTIFFSDWHPELNQQATIFVSDNTSLPEKSTELIVDAYSVELGTPFVAELLPENFWAGDIIQTIWTWWDDTKNVTAGELVDIHTYKKIWLYRLQALLVTRDAQQWVHEATLEVTGENPCFANEGVCDLDEDGIVDQCDTDLDGDGHENMLGILIWENGDCTFDGEIIDADRLLEQHDLIGEWGEYDNCSFIENTDQSDADQDSFGDACDSRDDSGDDSWWDTSWWGNNGWIDTWWDNSTSGWATAWWQNAGGITAWWWGPDEDNDRDDDGIPDERDACPDIPESNNGSQWDDWCPEIPPSTAPDRSIIKVDNCVQCPCPKADFDAEVIPGDRVKAVLIDPSGDIVYSHTAPRIIQQK